MKILVGREYPEFVIPAIQLAQASIKILSYDWRMYPEDPANTAQKFTIEILRAQKRGIKIEAMVEQKGQANELKKVGIPAKTLPYKKKIHSKIVIIDDQLAIVGSHNITQSAFYHNIEMSVVIEKEEKIERIVEFFNNIFGI